MPYEAGLSRPWYVKGRVAAHSGKYTDMYSAWHSAKSKPKTPGGKVTAQESFYQGYHDSKERVQHNPPKGWVKASAVRIRKSGGKVMVDIRRPSIRHNPASAAKRHAQRCRCSDQGCPVHKGIPGCSNKAVRKVYRIDMEDRTGTPMCRGCANDALDSGVFR